MQDGGHDAFQKPAGGDTVGGVLRGRDAATNLGFGVSACPFDRAFFFKRGPTAVADETQTPSSSLVRQEMTSRCAFVHSGGLGLHSVPRTLTLTR